MRGLRIANCNRCVDTQRDTAAAAPVLAAGPPLQQSGGVAPSLLHTNNADATDLAAAAAIPLAPLWATTLVSSPPYRARCPIPTLGRLSSIPRPPSSWILAEGQSRRRQTKTTKLDKKPIAISFYRPSQSNRPQHTNFTVSSSFVLLRPRKSTTVRDMASGSRVVQTLRKSHAMGPSVRNLLSQYNLDPSQITSTGPYQTLLKADVLNYLNQRTTHATNPPSSSTGTKSTLSAPKPATSRSSSTEHIISAKYHHRTPLTQWEIDVINGGGVADPPPPPPGSKGPNNQTKRR
jgi:pyruvate/2-oxoglutarate dehydrogenase complex dihydrolipoamide acyltransferase (E2) component